MSRLTIVSRSSFILHIREGAGAPKWGEKALNWDSTARRRVRGAGGRLRSLDFYEDGDASFRRRNLGH